MSEPRQLREASPNPLTRTLLRSARADRPTALGKERAAAALAMVAGATAATMTAMSSGAAAGGTATGGAAGTAAASKSVLASALLKWVAGAMLSAAAVAGAVRVGQIRPLSDAHLAMVNAAETPAWRAPPAAIAVRPSANTGATDEGALPPTSEVTPAASPAVRPAHPLAVVPVSPAIKAAPPPAPANEASALRQETEMLGRAHEALAKGDPTKALEVLEALDVAFPGGALRDEAAVLRIEALTAGGKRQAALDEYDRFVARAPESPHLRRVRAVTASLRQERAEP